MPAEVSSSSLNHGLKLRGPSPKSPCVAEQWDVNIHSLTPQCGSRAKTIAYPGGREESPGKRLEGRELEKPEERGDLESRDQPRSDSESEGDFFGRKERP
ncbi:hypothetical protein TNCV_224451 [Trichonephila clavipes]|nr:hypothetical protein TNCV_224451 [Trichonephila clavipes]